MKQCQEELLRKKNSIIENLQSTEKSLLDKVNTNPRLWGKECFKFILNSQAILVLDADSNVQDRAERFRQNFGTRNEEGRNQQLNDGDKGNGETYGQDELFRQHQEIERSRKVFKLLKTINNFKKLFVNELTLGDSIM